MLPDDDVAKIKNKYIQEAYKMSELQFNDRRRVQEDIPELWKEFNLEEKLQETEKQLQESVTGFANIFAAQPTNIPFTIVPQKLREAVLTELRSRHVDVSQYEKETEQAKTRPSTTKE